MDEPTAVHSTFVIERSYLTPPERVFAAFADPAKKRRWFCEGEGHDVEAFEMEFWVGGGERMLYRFKAGAPFPGAEMASEGRYQDIVPGRRIVIAQTMDIGGRRISAALVTVELLRTDAGTDMICTHQGTFLEGADGPQMREAGWRKLFEQLAAEVACA